MVQEFLNIIGLFTVAIFGPFLTHFWLHFWIIFVVWQKNDYKMKKKMTWKWLPWTPWNAKITKMRAKCILHVHRLCWQCSAHSNSTSKDLVIFFSWTCHYKKTKYNGYYLISFFGVIQLIVRLKWSRGKVYIPLKITSMKYIFKIYRTPHRENRALGARTTVWLLAFVSSSPLPGPLRGCWYLPVPRLPSVTPRSVVALLSVVVTCGCWTSLYVERMFKPGAKISMHLPWLEK